MAVTKKLFSLKSYNMSEKILDQKVTAPSIIGATTINHAARVYLGLNCSEYVLMNYIYQCWKNKTPMTTNDVYRKTGFCEEEQLMVGRSLAKKGFMLLTEGSIPVITSKWASAFTNLEDEFEHQFWTMNGKNLWSGSSKKQSLKFYIEVRKAYPKETIINGRNDYIEYLSWEKKNGFDRAIMGCEKFLNPKNEYFLADWKSKTDAIKAKLQPVEPKKDQLTKEERSKAYGNE